MGEEMTLDYALSKWQDVKSGKKVIFSDETLDILSEHFNPLPEDNKDADLFYHNFVTETNKKRVGVKDQYIGYLKNV